MTFREWYEVNKEIISIIGLDYVVFDVPMRTNGAYKIMDGTIRNLEAIEMFKDLFISELSLLSKTVFLYMKKPEFETKKEGE